MIFQPPLNSIKLEDIINYVESDVVVLKIDIEGYECKALQPDILLNKLGKFIPYIFMEWAPLIPGNKRSTCSDFDEWIKLFYDGGYLLLNPGERRTRFSNVHVHVHC